MSTDGLHDRLRAQAIAVLRGIPGRREELDESEYLFIRNARDEGVTWKEIGEALGLGSAQAAQQRQDRLAARVDPPAAPCQVCGGTCGIVCEKEAQREADAEFDRRVVESIGRIFIKADSAGYVFARVQR